MRRKLFAATAVLAVGLLVAGTAGSVPIQSGEQASSHGHGGGSWLVTAAGVLLLAAFPVGPAYWFSGRNTSERTKDPVHLLTIVLLLITGIVHLYIYVAHGETIMLLAGLGFLGGVGLFAVGFAQRYLYPIGIVYTLAQLVLWFQAGMPHLDSYGLADKVVQVAIIGLLGYLYVREYRSTPSGGPDAPQ